MRRAPTATFTQPRRPHPQPNVGVPVSYFYGRSNLSIPVRVVGRGSVATLGYLKCTPLTVPRLTQHVRKSETSAPAETTATKRVAGQRGAAVRPCGVAGENEAPPGRAFRPAASRRMRSTIAVAT